MKKSGRIATDSVPKSQKSAAAASLNAFFRTNGFTQSRDFIGNFNRGAELYYKEVAPDRFLVFCNNHFSLFKDSEQFELFAVVADAGLDFLYTMLQQPPRSITRRFAWPKHKALYLKEIAKYQITIKL